MHRKEVSRMRTCWVLFCLIVLALACSTGHCTIPSFKGYTGLMIVPTADALGKGDWNAGVFAEDVSSGTVNDYVANYGIYQGLEIGVDRFRLNDESDSQTLLNVKYKFMSETPSRPALAAGISDITDDVETTVYVVASKSLGCNLEAWRGEILNPRIHVGFGGGRLSGIFVGASGYLGRRFQLMAEWDGETVQAGARYRVTDVVTLHAGGFNLADDDNVEGSEGISFGAGISFNMTY